MTTTRTRLASLAVLVPVGMALLGGTALADTPAKPALPPHQIAIPAPQPIGPQDLAPAPKPAGPQGPKDLGLAPVEPQDVPDDKAPAPKPQQPQGPDDLANAGACSPTAARATSRPCRPTRASPPT